jgi:hypothetical protein
VRCRTPDPLQGVEFALAEIAASLEAEPSRRRGSWLPVDKRSHA